ncbi:MAG TPA: alanine racemase [Legionella sp.]|nr:alanine racemase [Legionella sp.]
MYKGKGIPTNMGMDHVGLVVPNAQLAADFLIEVFDAEFDWEVKREPIPNAVERGWDRLFGVHPESYMPHVIMLKCGEQALTQYIELFEWKSPDQPLRDGELGWHKFSDMGNSYISFSVKNIERVINHIKEQVIPKWPGVRFIQDPPMQFPLRGEVCTSTFLVSPWGMWIELTSWSESQHKCEVIKSQREPEINPWIGQSIYTLPTPAFMIDLDIVDHNIMLIRDKIITQGIHWRIPSKAHKSPDLSRYIIDRGATGVVLLTLTEAEHFADKGIEDIYLANQVGCAEELTRLALLAKKIKKLRVAVDNIDYLRKLVAAIKQWEIITPIEVLIELNINHNRCGTTINDAVTLAKYAYEVEKTSKAVVFSGITGYEGHTPILSPETKTTETRIAHDILAKAKALIEAEGIPVKVVSGGGSCNYIDCLDIGILNEIQAGGGAIGDLLYYHKAHLKNHAHLMGALLLTQIISVPTDQSRAIGNAGFKSAGWHPFGGLPQPRDRKDLQVIGLSAEHTKIAAIDEGKPVALSYGDKLVLIPGYTDAMGFLHQKIYAIRKDRVEQVWVTG